MNTKTSRQPGKYPLKELGVGDVIRTDGLEGLGDEPEVRIVENSAMGGGHRYLATEPPDQPGAVTRRPQHGDTEVELIRGDDVSYPQFLRWVADLLEQVPEIPHYRHGLDYSAGRAGDDSVAPSALRAAHEALDAAGVDHEFKDTEYAIHIDVVFGDRHLQISHLYADAWAEVQARISYERNVQVDAAAGGA